MNSKKYSNTISIASKLNGFKDELDLIAHLDVMLSMNSGNAHFAAMQQTPTTSHDRDHTEITCQMCQNSTAIIKPAVAINN